MNTELTDAMVEDMDSTADFMHTVPAPVFGCKDLASTSADETNALRDEK